MFGAFVLGLRAGLFCCHHLHTHTHNTSSQSFLAVLGENQFPYAPRKAVASAMAKFSTAPSSRTPLLGLRRWGGWRHVLRGCACAPCGRVLCCFDQLPCRVLFLTTCFFFCWQLVCCLW